MVLNCVSFIAGVSCYVSTRRLARPAESTNDIDNDIDDIQYQYEHEHIIEMSTALFSVFGIRRYLRFQEVMHVTNGFILG
jgi:hypothetical protein